VELKKSTAKIEEKYKDQLFSYLKLMQINIGVLICDRIHLFLYNPNKSYKLIEVTSVEFIKNSAEGQMFLSNFSKPDFTKERIIEYFENELDMKSAVEKVRKELTQ